MIDLTPQEASAKGPYVCTASAPWHEHISTKGRQIVHPDAQEGAQIDDWYGGSYVWMSCPHCKHEWKMELPD